MNADTQSLGERPLTQPHKAAQGGYVFAGVDLACHQPSPLARSDRSIEISFAQLACVFHAFISGILDTVAVLVALPIWR